MLGIDRGRGARPAAAGLARAGGRRRGGGDAALAEALGREVDAGVRAALVEALGKVGGAEAEQALAGRRRGAAGG